MLIGANLRKLRFNKNLTQEQLAAVFGVSPQAVSRWENDTAYPDITMLPGMASFYGVTVDELLGVDQSACEQERNRIHCEVHQLVENGEREQAVLLLRESLKRYPNNSGLLIELCTALTALDEPEALREAIVIGEQLLKNADVSLKAKSTVTVTLIYLYLKTADLDNAGQKVSSLPHFWECRELMLPQLADQAEYRQALKDAVIQMLSFFCDRIDAIPMREYGEIPGYLHLGVSFDLNREWDAMLDKLRDFLKS